MWTPSGPDPAAAQIGPRDATSRPEPLARLWARPAQPLPRGYAFAPLGLNLDELERPLTRCHRRTVEGSRLIAQSPRASGWARAVTTISLAPLKVVQALPTRTSRASWIAGASK